MASRLYYEPTNPSAFAALQKLRDAVRQNTSKQTKNMARADIKNGSKNKSRTSYRETLTMLLISMTFGNVIWSMSEVSVNITTLSTNRDRRLFQIFACRPAIV